MDFLPRFENFFAPRRIQTDTFGFCLKKHSVFAWKNTWFLPEKTTLFVKLPGHIY